MRTRIVQWLDMSKLAPTPVQNGLIFGIDVYADGRWRHAHRSGKPMFYKTRKAAEKACAILRNQP